MITLLLNFVIKWRWVLIAAGSIVLFSAGFYTRSVLYHAGEASKLEQALKDQRVADTKQFNHDLAVAKGSAIIKTMNDNFNKTVEYETSQKPVNCLVGIDRVQFINRAAANN